MPIISSRSPKETRGLAEKLAKKILSKKPRGKSAAVIALVGDLGVGKTLFAQAFIKALGAKQRIISPTFLLMRNYKFPARVKAAAGRQIPNYKYVYHIDCYRIKKPAELLKLGLKEILADPKNIVLIEWADKIKKQLPPKTIRINFSHGRKENERLIDVFSAALSMD